MMVHDSAYRRHSLDDSGGSTSPTSEIEASVRVLDLELPDLRAVTPHKRVLVVYSFRWTEGSTSF